MDGGQVDWRDAEIHVLMPTLTTRLRRLCRNKDDRASKSDMICSAYLVNE
jgi:hypothetical protein